MIVTLPWPDKLLWPNGPTGNKFQVARLKKKFRHDAEWATIEARGKGFQHDGGEIPVTLIVYAQQYGPLPDKDNCVAAVKLALDGIAKQIGVNDKHFAAPIVEFAAERTGKIEVRLG